MSRIRRTKLLCASLAALVLVSHHVYAEESLADLLLEQSGLVLLLVSAIGRIWAAAYISGNKNWVLVTGGPYSLVRHPLYLFSLVGFVGAGLAFESLLVAGLMALLFFASHSRTIRTEEVRLHARFGAEFDRYASAVPRLLPRLAWPRSPERVELSAKKLTRAIGECALIPLVFCAAHLVEWLHVHAILPVYLHLI